MAYLKDPTTRDQEADGRSDHANALRGDAFGVKGDEFRFVTINCEAIPVEPVNNKGKAICTLGVH